MSVVGVGTSAINTSRVHVARAEQVNPPASAPYEHTASFIGQALPAPACDGIAGSPYDVDLRLRVIYPFGGDNHAMLFSSDGGVADNGTACCRGARFLNALLPKGTPMFKECEQDDNDPSSCAPSFDACAACTAALPHLNALTSAAGQHVFACSTDNTNFLPVCVNETLCDKAHKF